MADDEARASAADFVSADQEYRACLDAWREAGEQMKTAKRKRRHSESRVIAALASKGGTSAGAHPTDAQNVVEVDGLQVAFATTKRSAKPSPLPSRVANTSRRSPSRPV